MGSVLGCRAESSLLRVRQHKWAIVTKLLHTAHGVARTDMASRAPLLFAPSELPRDRLFNEVLPSFRLPGSPCGPAKRDRVIWGSL